MQYLVEGREPLSLFHFFEDLCAIPHGSYHEEGIVEYLQKFAEARNLEFFTDEFHNVLIKKSAAKGKEESAPLLLQAHTDMVCEKNGDVEHDFEHDALKLAVEGKYLTAKGTTLGGDDGIGVAIMLAILDGAMPNHPALECLFTAAEEVGLDGANNFDYSKIQAGRLINLDGEDLAVVTVGCSGGMRSTLTLQTSPVPFAGNSLCVSVKGLCGGHSGVEINCGRANANKVMGRLLSALLAEQDMHLISIEGGSKVNAIPRECIAHVAVPDVEIASEILTEEAAKIASELVAEDRGFTVTVDEEDPSDVMLTAEDSKKALAVLREARNGVLEMHPSIEGLVRFSRNLGVVQTENGEMIFKFSSRSPLEAQIDQSECELDALAEKTGCQAKHFARYPGWNDLPNSEIRDIYVKACEDVTKKTPEIVVIHAGLECGIIHSHLPNMDMISVGPNIVGIHAPGEKLDLDATETFWKILTRTVERL